MLSDFIDQMYISEGGKPLTLDLYEYQFTFNITGLIKAVKPVH